MGISTTFPSLNAGDQQSVIYQQLRASHSQQWEVEDDPSLRNKKVLQL